MKKRTEQIIKYFHRRSFNLAFNDENGNYNFEDTIKKIQDFTYEERIDYSKSILEISILSDYLETNENVYFGCTNMFKMFSDELKKSSFDPRVISKFLLDLVENYPDKMFNYNETNTFDYVIMLKTFLGKYFDLNDFSEFCNGKPRNVHEIVCNNKDLEKDVCRMNLNVYFNFKNINDCVKKIRSSYFDKKETFTKEDINVVYVSFIRLRVSHIFAQEIRKILTDKYNKRTNNTFVYSSKNENHQLKDNLITDKEYKKILKEIKKYYNLYTRELISDDLTSEEREHIASLMVRIGLEQYKIADFLKATEKLSKTYTYDYFKNHIEEFEFYFGEELNQVFEYMKEIENCTTEEDKEYWIIGINEELSKLQYSNKLASYEYERQLLERK